MAKQGTLAGITLKGSAELVAEFFSFGINSILYQRGIYPPETFTRVTQYNLSILVTTDSKLKSYLNNVVVQLKEWLFNCTVQKLVVVITCIETNEVLERWQFDIECDKSAKDSANSIRFIEALKERSGTKTLEAVAVREGKFGAVSLTDNNTIIAINRQQHSQQLNPSNDHYDLITHLDWTTCI
ncbi:Mitotic spindle assembly checkpoint protein MAD2A [Acipenser ruthenus]|uniref:Mitotic spindle assembly checkpoint protein MAD2A n=1 Tax=Acipenser ruthenus TaxID=7906 RepID=A0A662YQV8_ACIRT|nr:Mitotic spindle assembly checkpoint protein MAD2A [Acipenser ruthenus]